MLGKGHSCVSSVFGSHWAKCPSLCSVNVLQHNAVLLSQMS